MTESSPAEPVIRYPETLSLIRHAESEYNRLKVIATQWESFQEFHKCFKADFYADAKARIPKDDLDLQVLEGLWPSPELHALAMAYYREIRALMKGVSDFDTPITDLGREQALETGRNIADVIPKPDVIYVSPYLRPHQTLDAILEGAPSDWKDIPQWENESIREQEHGMNTVFNDWRLSYVFDPMEMIHAVKQGEYAYRFRGGESKYDVRDRSSRFLGRTFRKHRGENVLAVTHHLTILSTLAEVLHWNRAKFMEWDEKHKPANCGVTIFRRKEGVSRTGKDMLKLAPEDYNRKLYTN